MLVAMDATVRYNLLISTLFHDAGDRLITYLRRRCVDYREDVGVIASTVALLLVFVGTNSGTLIIGLCRSIFGLGLGYWLRIGKFGLKFSG